MFVPGQQALITVIDLALVTFLVYRLLKLIRGTRAWRVVLGIGVFIVVLVLSDFLQFKTLHFVLEKATLLGPVALVILFLPELRQAIEGFARIGQWSGRLISHEENINGDTLEEIVAAVAEMADQKTGALIVIEREARLDDIAENGVPVKAQVTAALLATLFYDGSPMHDGAAIIRSSQILAASCRLPLSENPRIDPHYHMRHRAGIGISEAADCVVIIISEEKGKVNLAIDGRLIPINTGQGLRDYLNQELRGGLHVKKPKRKKPTIEDKEKVG